MGRWMINCQEYSRLTSESMDRSLSFFDRLSVRIHQLICPPCKRLRQQLDAIRKACRLFPEGWDDDRGMNADRPDLPDKASRRMKSVLKEQLK